MKTKLVAVVIALFVVGCGLDTEGLGAPDDGTPPDVSDDTEPDAIEEAESDIGPEETELDVPEIAEDDAGEDEGPDDAEADEAAEDINDVTDAVEDAEPEDAAEDVAPDEATDESGEADAEDAGTEDGDTEDGEVDPCALPPIPTTGIFIFYCFDYDLLSPMALEFQAERAGIPVVSWREAPGCRVASSRRLECTLTPTVWNATYIFNIRLDPGVGIGWSCGPELLAIWGTPHVWLDGVELTVTPVTNGDGGCNHNFLTPLL
jgi:hypothetical protein